MGSMDPAIEAGRSLRDARTLVERIAARAVMIRDGDTASPSLSAADVVKLCRQADATLERGQAAVKALAAKKPDGDCHAEAAGPSPQARAEGKPTPPRAVEPEIVTVAVYDLRRFGRGEAPAHPAVGVTDRAG